MQYVSVPVSVLNSTEFVGSEPVQRATWLCLVGFCCDQENGGVIEDCRSWTDRKWQQIAHVTKAEVSQASDLWRFDGENLEVFAFPVTVQTKLQEKRLHGHAAALKRWQNDKAKATEPIKQPDAKPSKKNRSPNAKAYADPDDNPDADASGGVKSPIADPPKTPCSGNAKPNATPKKKTYGMEGNGMEWKGEIVAGTNLEVSLGRQSEPIISPSVSPETDQNPSGNSIHEPSRERLTELQIESGGIGMNDAERERKEFLIRQARGVR